MPKIEELEKIVKKLQEIMRIQDYDIRLEFLDKYKMKHEGNDDDFGTVMLTETDLRKNNVIIFINIDHQILKTQWYISIVHELFHVVTARNRYLTTLEESSELLTTTNENMVEHLAKIFVSIYTESKIKEDLI